MIGLVLTDTLFYKYERPQIWAVTFQFVVPIAMYAGCLPVDYTESFVSMQLHECYEYWIMSIYIYEKLNI